MSKARQDRPFIISTIHDKDGNLIYGTQEDVERSKKDLEAQAALERGDEETYDRIMKELYSPDENSEKPKP